MASYEKSEMFVCDMVYGNNALLWIKVYLVGM